MKIKSVNENTKKLNPQSKIMQAIPKRAPLVDLTNDLNQLTDPYSNNIFYRN